MPPGPSKIRKYTEDELDNGKLDQIRARARELLGVEPFPWQIKVASAVLQGKDVMVDVGTGCGKSACFILPLLLHDEDIALVVSPLSALMIDQAKSAKVPSIAICHETLQERGTETLYTEIASGRYRQVLVSPEILSSPQFRTQVLVQPTFYEHLRMAFVDEAHCVSLWGGSFRPDYATLGTFRGKLPRNVPMCTCTATSPDHITDAIRASLCITEDAVVVAITNARPNVALSVRAMRHSDKSKADLRFIIPEGAAHSCDIPIQLIYCNSRIVVEDVADVVRQWLPNTIPGIEHTDVVAFYHAKVGESRKRELEEKLRTGAVRILICTDAVGMGCDMRNISRVVLWGLPPSFCALVQRAGRAARVMTELGEAILIVPGKVLKDGVDIQEISKAVEAAAHDAEAQNGELAANESTDHELESGMQVYDGNQVLLVAEGGVRIEAGDFEEDETEPFTQSVGAVSTTSAVRTKGKKRSKVDCNTIEARFLKDFACTTRCRRRVWNLFFGNYKKLQLTTENTTYRPSRAARCCDNCQPDRFLVEEVVVEKGLSLKRGRKKKLDTEMEQSVRETLTIWRNNDLLKILYPSSTALISGQALLGDDVVEQLATCGEIIRTGEQLSRRIRWPFAWAQDGSLSPVGTQLLATLSKAYQTFDDWRVEEESYQNVMRNTTTLARSTPIPVERFYAPFQGRGQRGSRGQSSQVHTTRSQTAQTSKGRTD